MLAEASRQQLLGTQIFELYVVVACQPMLLVDDELKILGKERPGVQPRPILIDLGGDAEFGFPLLQEFPDLSAGAAQKPEFKTVELSLDLLEVRNQQRQVYRVGKCNSERADFAALERRCQRTRAGGGLKALL